MFRSRQQHELFDNLFHSRVPNASFEGFNVKIGRLFSPQSAFKVIWVLYIIQIWTNEQFSRKFKHWLHCGINDSF